MSGDMSQGLRTHAAHAADNRPVASDLGAGVGHDVLAVDIGGTKVALAVVAADGAVTERRIIRTPSGPPDAAVETILCRAAELMSDYPVRACGIVLPAIVDEGRIAWAAESIGGWEGIALRHLATERLHVPCVVDFDGYGATLGEWWQGSARGYRDAAIVIVGTGVGAGLIHEGELYRGAAAIAGGIGWLHFPHYASPGPRLEDVASGPAILAEARRLRGRDHDAYSDTPAVFTAALAGDPAAAGAVERGLLALTAGVGAIVALLAPEIVVLGGGVGARPDVVERVRQMLMGMTQPFAARGVRVEGSSLGALSSLYGAAYLAHRLTRGKEI